MCDVTVGGSLCAMYVTACIRHANQHSPWLANAHQKNIASRQLLHALCFILRLVRLVHRAASLLPVVIISPLAWTDEWSVFTGSPKNLIYLLLPFRLMGYQWCHTRWIFWWWIFPFLLSSQLSIQSDLSADQQWTTGHICSRWRVAWSSPHTSYILHSLSPWFSLSGRALLGLPLCMVHAPLLQLGQAAPHVAALSDAWLISAWPELNLIMENQKSDVFLPDARTCKMILRVLNFFHIWCLLQAFDSIKGLYWFSEQYWR